MSTQPGTVPLSRKRATRKPRGKRYASSFVKHAVLILLGISFVFPLFWMISTSVKPSFEQMVWPPVWIPHPFQWSNYPSAMKFEPFLHYIFNTLYYCIAAVIGTVLSCSLVAYGFARIEFPERGFLFFLMLATMMLPFQVTMIPLFVLFKNIGWVGSFKPLIIPCFFGNAFQIFLLRQFFMTIPRSLSEAAYMDGASEFKIFYRIILPLAKPALATVALFQFMYCWNDFLGPIIYLNNSSLYTISLGLQQYVSSYGTQWGLLMAASTVATLPLIILYFLTQRTFIEGISVTGLKG